MIIFGLVALLKSMLRNVAEALSVKVRDATTLLTVDVSKPVFTHGVEPPTGLFAN